MSQAELIKSLAERAEALVGKKTEEKPAEKVEVKTEAKLEVKKAEGSEKPIEKKVEKSDAKEKEGEVKAESDSDKVSISKEDFELLKKAKEDCEKAKLEKAQKDHKELIKSAVIEATKDKDDKIEKLEKTLGEVSEGLKKLAASPVNAHAGTNEELLKSMQAIEKSGGENAKPAFTKTDRMRAAMELVAEGNVNVTAQDVAQIKLSDNVSDPYAKADIEQRLIKNSK